MMYAQGQIIGTKHYGYYERMHTLVLLYKLVCILASNIITTVVCRPGVW